MNNVENEAGTQYWLIQGWNVNDVYFCFDRFFFFFFKGLEHQLLPSHIP